MVLCLGSPEVPKMFPKALGRSLEPSCRNVNMRNGKMWRMVAASQGSWLPKTKDVQKCGDPNVGAMGGKSCTEPWSARRHRGVPAEARLDMARPLQSAKALKKHHDWWSEDFCWAITRVGSCDDAEARYRPKSLPNVVLTVAEALPRNRIATWSGHARASWKPRPGIRTLSISFASLQSSAEDAWRSSGFL
jgi:hypothetical protein